MVIGRAEGGAILGGIPHLCNTEKGRVAARSSDSNTPMGTIGERVREARTEKKWSQERLALAVGLRSKRTIGELESGEHHGSGKLHRIAEALGVNVKWLETGQGPKLLNELSARDEPGKTGKFSDEKLPTASHLDESLAPILATAESWVRFEEKAASLRGEEPWGPRDGLQSVRRAGRLIAFAQLIQEHGGQLDPREAAEIIDAARNQGATEDGKRESGGGE
jgi:transcriptional regulator with XRE-family HTH domain